MFPFLYWNQLQDLGIRTFEQSLEKRAKLLHIFIDYFNKIFTSNHFKTSFSLCPKRRETVVILSVGGADEVLHIIEI